MKAKDKRFRRMRRMIGKAIRFIMIAGVIFAAVVWLRPHYPKIEQYFKRFGSLRIEASEIDRYYGLLSRYERPGKDMILDLGVKENDDLQLVLNKLKGVMGLGDKKMLLLYHDAEKPPAYVKHIGGDDIKIFVSKKVTERREEINLLTHELGHIYVWRLEPAVFSKCDQERLVDCSSVFLGLGVLILNGLTDETTLSLGEGYETRKKFFGYLKPEQFGYLLARYCAEHGVLSDAVLPFLNPTGKKYFNYGLGYLKKKSRAISASAGQVTGIYWCPRCGSFNRIPLTEKIKTPKCSNPNCKN